VELRPGPAPAPLLSLAVAFLLLLLASVAAFAPAASAQPSPPQYTPTSVVLTALPPLIEPNGSGVVVVQLVNGQGVPEPASSSPPGSALDVDLYSSNPGVISVEAHVQIPYGESHAEANFTAFGVGNATITAVANGLNAGSVNVMSSTVLSYSLRVALSPLREFAAPGDVVPVLLQLMAGNVPFVTPVPVQASVASSVSGSPIASVEVQPGSSFAYFDIVAPSTPSFFQLTAAAAGFMSNSTSIDVVAAGSGSPGFMLLASNGTAYQSGTTIQLSVSLMSSSFQPVQGPVTVEVFSSNDSVVSPLVNSITVSGDSGVFQAKAGAPGTAELTVLAPGVASSSLRVRVVNPYEAKLKADAPSLVRGGETYSFSAEFVGANGILLPYQGPVVVSAYSNGTSVLDVAGQLQMASGYGVGAFTVAGAGFANITVIVGGYQAAFASVRSYESPLVAPVTYQVEVLSYAGPLAGVPVNFTYGGETTVVVTDAGGVAPFAAYNDTSTVASVPASFVLANSTFYFTGWSSGAKGENVSLLSSSPTYLIAAQYFRSVVPTTYSLRALSDGQEPVAGLRFNVSSSALKENFTVTTGSDGIGNFILPNASSITISVPGVFQPSGETRYVFLSLGNTTKDVVSFSAPAAATFNATYATYFQFQVTSPIGTTTGSGWYRDGSAAPYSVSETSSGGPLVFQRFAGWTGSFSSSQPTGSAVITAPESIVAQWSTDDTFLFAAAGAVVAVGAVIGLFIFRLRKKAPPS
jgi:hypothetical protein